MKAIKRFLRHPKSTSLLKSMPILSLLAGMGIGVYGVYAGKELAGVAEICAVFVGAAFTAQVAKKYSESKDVE